MASLGVSDLFNVNGMVFVVTGGGSGLGEWMSLALDKNGASKVYILGRRLASLEKVASKAVNGKIIPVQADQSSKDSLKAAAETIASQTPFVNVVIANGGVGGTITGLPPRVNPTVESIQEQLWNTSFEENSKMQDINVLGPYYTFLAFMKLLEAGNTHPDSRGKTDFIQSQFISVTSLGGFSRKELVSYPYGSAKAALQHMTKMLSTNFASFGIRANSIAPGLFVTEMTEDFVGEGDTTVPGSLPVEMYPATRTGSAQDIAGAVLFLASKAGAYVNGIVLLTDGGQNSLEPSTY